MPLIEDLGKGTVTGPSRFYSYSRVPAGTTPNGGPGSVPGVGSGVGANSSGAGGRTKRLSTYTPRVADSATRQRAILKRITDLEKENYNDQYSRFEIPNLDALMDTSNMGGQSAADANGNKVNKRRSTAQTSSKSGSTPATRKILASLKTLLNLRDDDPASARDLTAVLVAGPRYPVSVQLCGMCGFSGKYVCARCGCRYCGLACDETHKETRCVKMYA